MQGHIGVVVGKNGTRERLDLGEGGRLPTQ